MEGKLTSELIGGRLEVLKSLSSSRHLSARRRKSGLRCLCRISFPERKYQRVNSWDEWLLRAYSRGGIHPLRVVREGVKRRIGGTAINL